MDNNNENNNNTKNNEKIQSEQEVVEVKKVNENEGEGKSTQLQSKETNDLTNLELDITKKVNNETIVEDKQVNIGEIVNEIIQRDLNGELKDNEIEELSTKYNIPREMYEGYKDKKINDININNDRILKEKFNTNIEEFNEASKFALNNWSESEINDFNNEINNGTEYSKKIILDKLISSYKSNQQNTNQQTINYHTNNFNSNSEFGGVFKTINDFSKLIYTDRYKTDAEYRNKIDEKFKRSGLV